MVQCLVLAKMESLSICMCCTSFRKIYWQDVPEYVKDGSAYAYLDNEDMEFTLSPTLITSPQSVAGLTLNQVYDAYENRATPSGQAHLFYNDANLDINDDSYNSKWGHTKGAMA
uniref:Uncharacterized protein n=1 Tax=Clytia hemisphaerica TaxID=252671 RepID=A0A7M5TYF8_9CNID